MAMTPAQRQANHKARLVAAAEKSAKRYAALCEVLEIVKDSERPTGMRIRAIVESALKEEGE